MEEYVGVCHICNKHIYCLDGFLNGFVEEDGRLSCFEGMHRAQEDGVLSQDTSINRDQADE